MATLIELNLAFQTINNLAGLQRDMVQNANTHKGQLAAGGSVPVLIQAAQDCAAAYQRRLGWVTAITGDSAKLTLLTNGILALGGTVTNANASVTTLLNAAQALASALATATTGADVTTACNALLAAVPAPVVVY